ncbi:MAG: hypothetical protein WB930_12965 [Syntrophobacteraceae bacterium]
MSDFAGRFPGQLLPTPMNGAITAFFKQDPRVKPKCPECGSESVRTKWSLTTIVAWLGRKLGVSTVKIFEKKCMECGHEFQVLRK